MTRKIRKAVFPVAGFGTRFLPSTKAMPKELLPVVNKPLVQYAAEEAIAAGCDTLIFVTGRHKRAIEDYFDSNLELEIALRGKGREKEADMVRNILPPGVECIFVRQPEQLGLGDAVLCAERVVGDEPFVIVLADDFFLGQTTPVTSDLIRAYEKTGMSQLSVREVNGPDISKYGVIKLDKDKKKLVGLIEKPDEGDAPSNLASMGRYVLNPEVFDILRHQELGRNGEVQLADAINKMAKNGSVEFSLIRDGQCFDCGSWAGYLDAILHVSKTKGN